MARVKRCQLTSYQQAVQGDALHALLTTARRFVTVWGIGPVVSRSELTPEQKALCADLAFSLAKNAPRGVE
jgi:hypothetical protein